MPRRCFSEAPIADDHATLAGSEAHHLLHVLRAAPGMVVTLFDGSGMEFDAEVAACGRSTVDLNVLERREVDRELPFPITLGVALPKGDRQRWIVEKAVELGVTRLVPLITERSEKQGGEKLGRYVIEASKQCGRNRLMEIAEPQRWYDWLAAIPVGEAAPPIQAWIAHPTGRPLVAGDTLLDRPALIAIGPEGGLTDEETAAAAGWKLIGLGPRILRIETAAIGLVAALTLPAS
ncbi:MAG: 16S rRNA (uracil(1498)-N(3))-methyltransferase [Pirellulales bacterium]|nr:16S rRNA (uracil(1498)-N(3))-methyltransferase [Pirellulales bacterium]